MSASPTGIRLTALAIHAGPRALAHIRAHGLQPQDVALVPAAAGGPKGLILTPLDQHLFGEWLPQSGPTHRLHLVGASIGAWRMATALLPDARMAFADFARAYIHQHADARPDLGQVKRPPSSEVSATFARTLDHFFTRRLPGLLSPERAWSLHIVTSRGRGMLSQAGRWRTPAGFGGLALHNTLSRKGLGRWLERTVFSSNLQGHGATRATGLPMQLDDLPTQEVLLTPANFLQALRASCSIPFWFDPVEHIAGSPCGPHWDGGIVDYHFHWPFDRIKGKLVLYPHFQRQVIPGWLDKKLKRRHQPTPWLDNLIVICPKPEWASKLPQGRLPDRDDFIHMAGFERIRMWQAAVAASQQLADEWQGWLLRGCPANEVQPL
jgi:Patatin-like phospholipase